MALMFGPNTAKTVKLAGMYFMHFDNQNQHLKNPRLFHLLTNSMTIPGLENKNHFP